MVFKVPRGQKDFLSTGVQNEGSPITGPFFSFFTTGGGSFSNTMCHAIDLTRTADVLFAVELFPRVFSDV